MKGEILKFSVKLGDGVVDMDLAGDLKFSSEDLNTAYIEQSAKFAYWAVLATQSKTLSDKKKWEVDRYENYLKTTLEGELDNEVRITLTMEGEKITESKVESKIHTHPKYLEAVDKLNTLKTELIELQNQTNLLTIAKDAFVQRKDMIISLTKHSLSGGEEQNEEAVLNSVLYSWFNSIESKKDFFDKYVAFKKVDQIIKDSLLFDLVQVITSSKDKDDDQIRRALLIYDSFSEDNEYLKLSQECGYRIPKEFGEKESYYDDSLKSKIQFYYYFRDKLDEINLNLSRKGVSHK